MGNFFEKLKANKILLVCFTSIIAIIVVTEIIVVFYLKYDFSKNEKNKIDELAIEEQIPVETKVFVEIKGEVVTPGIYEIKSDKRVLDVIKLADGLTENADTSIINLSKKVVDEMVIVIYSKEQVTNFLKVKDEEKVLSEQCKEDSLTANNACLTNENDGSKINGLISINTGSKDELMTLPGIGESKALAIINYRTEIGAFENIQDLTKVSGIGEALYAQIKDLITT